MTLLKVNPSRQTKLVALAQAARHDLACACNTAEPRRRGPDGLWIYPAALPSGERVPMLKVLQASGCERNCTYCVERLGGVRGGSVMLEPDDLASTFMELYGQRLVVGLFLSSAIRGGARATMDRMLATGELLRKRYRFRGYLHLKLIPGALPDQVERAMSIATRVSINLEAPSATHLAKIAPGKRFHEQILATMQQVSRAQDEGRFDRAGHTTQLVVGAAGETDQEIAQTAAGMYKDLRLARVYYSAFQPLPGTPSEGSAPVPFLREHRLYQVDFLLRSYGFEFEEIPFDPDGRLSLDVDPKTAWAKAHPERYPIEVNTAPAAELMRIPGIGPRAAKRIVQARRTGRLRTLDALRAAGARTAAALPFVLIDGRLPPRQLTLF